MRGLVYTVGAMAVAATAFMIWALCKISATTRKRETDQAWLCKKCSYGNAVGPAFVGVCESCTEIDTVYLVDV